MPPIQCLTSYFLQISKPYQSPTGLPVVIYCSYGGRGIRAVLNFFFERIHLGPCGVVKLTPQGRMSENTTPSI